MGSVLAHGTARKLGFQVQECDGSSGTWIGLLFPYTRMCSSSSSVYAFSRPGPHRLMVERRHLPLELSETPLFATLANAPSIRHHDRENPLLSFISTRADSTVIHSLLAERLSLALAIHICKGTRPALQLQAPLRVRPARNAWSRLHRSVDASSA